MPDIYKVILTVLIAGIALLAGYRLFRYFNEKIRDSAGGWTILVYTVLFFVVCAGLFFGALTTLALIYGFLKTE